MLSHKSTPGFSWLSDYITRVIYNSLGDFGLQLKKKKFPKQNLARQASIPGGLKINVGYVALRIEA